MRSLAVVPPVLLDSRERRLCFDNRNGLVEDPMAEYRERPLLNVWTEQVGFIVFNYIYYCIVVFKLTSLFCNRLVGKRDFQGEVPSSPKEFWDNGILSRAQIGGRLRSVLLSFQKDD